MSRPYYFVWPTFPSPFLRESEIRRTGIGTRNPIGVPVERLFRWFYQVRSWKITMDLTIEASARTSSVSFSEDGIGWEPYDDRQDEVDAHNVLYHVTALNGYGSDSNGSYFPTPPSDLTFSSSAVVHASFRFAGAGTYIVVKDGLYYPSFEFSIQATGSAHVASEILDLHGSSNVTTTIGTPWSIGSGSSDIPEDSEIQIDGITVPVRALTSVLNSGSGASATVSLENINIVPDKFWPHDDGTGPAYHETSGAWLL